LFKALEAKPDGPVRVAYMPRKNSALATRIRQTLTARLEAGGPRVVWEEIHGLPPEGVAKVLSRSHIFLATGFPEGCPLPPLEAMACGCLVVGYTGFGGFDYMRSADGFAGHTPWWELRNVPWGGNGLYVADADVLGAALALETAANWVVKDDPRYHAAVDQARATSKAYSLDAQFQAVDHIWNTIEKS
jgi:glycosyltransferase involved in cell wall biosynthesis